MIMETTGQDTRCWRILGLRVTRDVSVMDLILLIGLGVAVVSYYKDTQALNTRQDERLDKVEAVIEKLEEQNRLDQQTLDTRLRSIEALLYRIAGRLDGVPPSSRKSP